MSEMYKSLTDFLPMLENEKIGDWVIDRVNNGTPERPIQMPVVNYTRIVREVEGPYMILNRTTQGMS